MPKFSWLSCFGPISPPVLGLSAPDGRNTCMVSNRPQAPGTSPSPSASPASQEGSTEARAPSSMQDCTRDIRAPPGAATSMRAQSASPLSPTPELNAANVQEISAFQLLEGLQLGTSLGTGTYGYVLSGLWEGARVAAKVVITETLDRGVLRELLVGPHMAHPNVVRTYFTRCARLSTEFLMHVERKRLTCPEVRERSGAVEGESGEGFGNPDRQTTVGEPLGPFNSVLYAAGATPSQIVTLVVMEECTQGTLSTVIYRGIFDPTRQWGERVSRRALLRTAAEVARGMIHLHNNGIVHGDLKPANVLLSQAREDRRGFIAKLADFGLAHRLLAGARHKSTANSWGTLAYMAPERFHGRVGFAGDVYSFGVVLWEMLYRQLPFKGMEPGDVALGLGIGELSLGWSPDHLTPDLITLGERCLDTDPDNRPSFVDVERELVRIEARLRAAAPQPPPAAPSPPIMPPPPPAAAAADGGAPRSGDAAGDAAAPRTPTAA